MAREKVDNKLNVVIGTKAQVVDDTTIPENSIIVVTDEELTASDIPQLPASKITQDANNRFVTDNEKSTWNGKQNALTAGDGISIVDDVISVDGGLNVEGWDTATKTLELSDSNKLIYCSYTDNQTLTIPANEDVAFPIGTMITFLLTSTYTVTFVGSHSGVDIMSMDSLVELKTQYSMASLIKLGANTWQLVGALE